MKKILIALAAVALTSASFAQGSIFSSKAFEKSSKNSKPVIVQVKPVVAAVSKTIQKSSSASRPWVQLPKGFEHAAFGKNDKDDKKDDKFGKGKGDKDHKNDDRYGWGKGHDKHDFLKHIKHDKKHWHKKDPISHC